MTYMTPPHKKSPTLGVMKFTIFAVPFLDITTLSSVRLIYTQRREEDF